MIKNNYNASFVADVWWLTAKKASETKYYFFLCENENFAVYISII